LILSASVQSGVQLPSETIGGSCPRAADAAARTGATRVDGSGEVVAGRGPPVPQRRSGTAPRSEPRFRLVGRRGQRTPATAPPESAARSGAAPGLDCRD
jgi:hypothetical protein